MSSALTPSPKEFPLLGVVAQQKPSLLVCERSFSLSSDPYLAHHRFGDVSFLPGVIGLELFAELAKLALPSNELAAFHNVAFLSGIKFKDDRPRKVIASLQFDSKSGLAQLKLLPNQKGNPAKQTSERLCFQTELEFAERTSKHQALPPIQNKPFLPQQMIYQILPHGPLLQVLAEINQLDDHTVVAIGDFSKRQLFGWKYKKLVVNPLAIEACFQAIGLLDFVATGKAGLPSKITHLTFYRTPSKPHYIF